MKKNNICIINYGVGNFFSIYKFIKKIDINTIVSNNYRTIESSKCIILPGVGSFTSAITFLKKNNLINLIKKKSDEGTKIIGICLGMQIMMTYGNENGYTSGLNFFKGEAVKIKKNKNYKIPNIGIRDLRINKNKKNNFLKKFTKKNFYFLHSYKVDIIKENVLGWSHMGDFKYDIPAIIQKKNIFGLQFHPEKSNNEGFLFFRELLKK